MRLLGRVMPKRFLTDFWTTLGRTIYVPDHVSDAFLYPSMVAHECTHVDQYIRHPVRFVLGYLLFPLPLGLAYCRWRYERIAYMYNLWENPTANNVEAIVQTLWSNYGWPWPKFLMRRWFNKQLEMI